MPQILFCCVGMISYVYSKIRERKVKTLTRNWRDHWRTNLLPNTDQITRRHLELAYQFVLSSRLSPGINLSQPPSGTFINSLVTPSLSCVHKHSLFWLIKTAVLVKISWYSFRVFSSVISSISGKSFHFPFPYFVIFVLRYFPFHVVIICLFKQRNIML